MQAERQISDDSAEPVMTQQNVQDFTIRRVSAGSAWDGSLEQ
jgi:hypothetical protein